MEKKERLLALIQRFSGGNKAHFAKMLGVTPQTVSTWLSRNTFDADKIFAFCEGVSGDWLLSGRGTMLSIGGTPPLMEDEYVKPMVSLDPKKGQPYYDVDFIGGFDEIINTQLTVPATNIIIQGFEMADLWCNVTGHSEFE